MQSPQSPMAFQPQTMQQPVMVPKQGLGELSAGSATIIGLAVAGAGAYGGYLLGAKLASPKHQLAGKIIGGIAGWIIVPAVVGAVYAAATASSAIANAPRTA